FVVGGPVGDSELLLCHGTVCVVGKMRDLILQLSKSSIYSTKPFEHYNEWHPHSALGYRSPREYLRQRASNGLSDNRCLEI
ncbi:hypothetical protein RRF87_26640, partial [Escherichia coli]|nr:hypothetical protein [Escherichia coli]MDT8585292.1 hypothetical protein [Escherichia coli]MDT8611631.1 hypothetical protein [Escherichia coli]MDT8670168.1 hypothetical protein [Escherichia coli]